MKKLTFYLKFYLHIIISVIVKFLYNNIINSLFLEVYSFFKSYNILLNGINLNMFKIFKHILYSYHTKTKFGFINLERYLITSISHI